MKKTRNGNLVKILFAVLVTAVVVCLGLAVRGITAHADTEEAHDHSTMTELTACPAGGELTAGAYYLGENIDGNITVTGEVTLCLNGHTVTGDGTGSVITVNENATFTLCDCVGTGVITGGTGVGIYGEGGGVWVAPLATFKLTGGTISNNTAYYGGGVWFDGTFEMTGGTISGNTAEYDGGGVVIGKSGAFTMSGGTISGNMAGLGGGVYFFVTDNDDYYSNGTFEMTGGTISGNEATEGGGVHVCGKNKESVGGAFIMTGGIISGNTAANGGGVHVSNVNFDGGGTFIMKNGTISGNTATNGGGVYVTEMGTDGGESLSLTASRYAFGDSDGDDNALIITGGTISENTAEGDGGGVFISGGAERGLVITGGTITGNTAQGYGGGVCVADEFKVSGAPNITGNKVNGVNDNVSMDLYTTITVTGEFAEGAKMGITLADGFSGAFTSSYGENNKDENDKIISPDKYFVSDKDGYFPTLENGEVLLSDGVATVTVNSVETRYGSIEDAWTYANNATTAATVKMYADAETTDTLTVELGKDITLNLNGHIIKYNNESERRSVITVSGGATFTLCDSAGTGVITGGNTTLNGGGVYVCGTFIMENGTISGNTAYLGGGVYVAEGGTFTMENGKISDNVASSGGGGVQVMGAFTMGNGTISGNTVSGGGGGGVSVAGYAEFRMTGGEISENEALSVDFAARGGGVFISNHGTFIMENGTISGNTAKTNGGGLCVDFGGANVLVSGTPNITDNKVIRDDNEVTDNVYMLGGEITVADELIDGAKIGIGNTGEVATGFTQGGDPSEYFVPDDPANNCVYEIDGTVSIGTHAFAEEFTVDKAPTCTEAGSKSKHCTHCGEKTEVTEIPALGHKLTHHTPKPATEDEDGNKEYWSCGECDKYFSDEAGTTEITDKSGVTVPKLTPSATAPEGPSAPAEDKQTYWWLFLLLIPLAIGAGGVTLGIWVYKKGK